MNDYQKGFELIHDLIKKRWVPQILHSIKIGRYTYTDILNSIDYLSNTELQRKLRVLEENKCIYKEEGNGGYYLTDFGREIEHLFNHFYELGKKYM
ncbi:winged helix-turn-helix transcriptional regulator [Peptoniphilaceae bacterium SGI.131]